MASRGSQLKPGGFDPSLHPRDGDGKFANKGQAAAFRKALSGDWSGDSGLGRAYTSGSMTTGGEPDRAQQRTLDLYTGGYRDTPRSYQINQRLREGRDLGSVQREMDGWIESNRLTKDTALYRGVSGDALDSVQPGDVIRDRGYQSTSANPGYAVAVVQDRSFMANKGGGGTILEIAAPAGTRAGPVPSRRDRRQAAMDQEFILARNQALRITGARPGPDGIRILSAEVENS